MAGDRKKTERLNRGRRTSPLSALLPMASGLRGALGFFGMSRHKKSGAPLRALDRWFLLSWPRHLFGTERIKEDDKKVNDGGKRRRGPSRCFLLRTSRGRHFGRLR